MARAYLLQDVGLARLLLSTVAGASSYIEVKAGVVLLVDAHRFSKAFDEAKQNEIKDQIDKLDTEYADGQTASKKTKKKSQN